MSNPTPKMMTLKCRHGDGHEWTRPSQRGKPPHFCPEHTVAGADNKVGATKKVEKKLKVNAVYAEPVVEAGEDISPQELQARMERERMIAERTAKAVATKAAKKEAEKVAQREREQVAIDRMTGEIDGLFARYDAAFADACKENTKQAWNKADSAQAACIQSMRVIRQGVTV